MDVGAHIGPYRIERLLGRGGMGEVYLATHATLDRRVALKLLPAELASDARFRTRFLAESRLAASLDHPHIVPIYEAGEADGRLFIAMRYVEGRDLASLIAADGPIPAARAVSLLRGIADALDAAHDRGLVHRDVKPGNILVSPTARAGEHAYLADFGLTKQLGSSADFTRAGQIVGSLGYVAPEQIEGRPVDARTDVYSLACVLYEALTGRPPYAGERDVATLWAHLQSPRPRPSDIDPELARFDPVIATGMAIDPAERYPNAGELLAAAAAGEAAGAGAGGAHAVAGVGMASASEASAGEARDGEAKPRDRQIQATLGGRQSSRRRYVQVIGIVALVVVASVGASLLQRGPGQQPARSTPARGTDVANCPQGSSLGEPSCSTPTTAPTQSKPVESEPAVTLVKLEVGSEGFQQPSDPLRAGQRYEMAVTRPRTRFTIPSAGWRADRDYVDGFNLARERINPASGAYYPDYFSMGVVQVVFDGPCVESETRAIAQTPSALIDFLVGHPTVEASAPRPLNFGTYSGLSTELTIEKAPTAGTCDAPEEMPNPVKARFLQRTYLFLFGEDTFHISPEERIRVVAVDVEGRLVVLTYGTVERDRWEAFAPEAERLLGSIELVP